MRGSQRKARRRKERQEGAGNEDEEEDVGFLIRTGEEEIRRQK